MPLGLIDSGTVLILVALVVLPIAGLSFAMGAGDALEKVGKGPLSINEDLQACPSGGGTGAEQGLRAEVRSLVVASNERRVRAGKQPLEVEQEIDRRLAELEDVG